MSPHGRPVRRTDLPPPRRARPRRAGSRAAGRPAAAAAARRGGRPGASDRARRRDRADGRGGQARLDDPVGAARHRQDHASPGCSPMRSGMRFVAISAVFSGVADLKKVFAEAREHAPAPASRPCCSWTRSTASTAPSRTASCPMSRTARSCWSARPPRTRASSSTPRLLSPRQVLILNRLDAAALGKLLDRAEALMGRPLPLTPEARDALIATRRRRRPLPAQPGRDPVLDRARRSRSIPPSSSALLHRRVAVYDKDREGHYNLISALHKSDPRLGSAGGALLSRADADRRRGAALRAAPPDPRRGRGYRPRRPAGAGPVPRRQGHLRLPRLARGRARDRPGLPLSRHRAQIERRLQGAEGAPGAAPRRPAR